MIVLRQKYFDEQPQEQRQGSGIGKKILKGVAAVGATAGAVYGAKKGFFGAGASKFVNKGLGKVSAGMQNLGQKVGTEGWMGRTLHNTGAKMGQSAAQDYSIANNISNGMKTSKIWDADGVLKKNKAITKGANKFMNEMGINRNQIAAPTPPAT